MLIHKQVPPHNRRHGAFVSGPGRLKTYHPQREGYFFERRPPKTSSTERVQQGDIRSRFRLDDTPYQRPVPTPVSAPITDVLSTKNAVIPPYLQSPSSDVSIVANGMVSLVDWESHARTPSIP